MAFFARDIFASERDPKPPVSAHPAFPAIVALWFAALLGFGSLVLPGVLLERLVAATGIGSLLPAANPPLGWTAQILMAVFAAAAGALAGFVIARQVVRAQMVEVPWDAGEFTVTRQGPISIHDEVGGDGVINGRGLPVTNRRALAIAEDMTADDFLYTAPLPGERGADTVAEDCELGAWPEDLGAPAADPCDPPADPLAEAAEWALDPDSIAGFESKPGPLDRLDMMELAQRLGTSLRNRRELHTRAAAQPDPGPVPPSPAGIEAAAPQEAAQAMADYFGRAENVPPHLSEATAGAVGRGLAPPVPRPGDADTALREALATIRRISSAA